MEDSERRRLLGLAEDLHDRASEAIRTFDVMEHSLESELAGRTDEAARRFVRGLWDSIESIVSGLAGSDPKARGDIEELVDQVERASPGPEVLAEVNRNRRDLRDGVARLRGPAQEEQRAATRHLMRHGLDDQFRRFNAKSRESTQPLLWTLGAVTMRLVRTLQVRGGDPTSKDR